MLPHSLILYLFLKLITLDNPCNGIHLQDNSGDEREIHVLEVTEEIRSEPYNFDHEENEGVFYEVPHASQSDDHKDLCDELHKMDDNTETQERNLEWMEPADVLLPRLRNRTAYNYFLAPGQTIGKTTNVRVALYIESMSSFKAATMDFEVDMYLAMSWVDHRLAHNCSHPVLINNLLLSEQIWHPDLYFVNSKFAYLQKVTTPNFMLLVYPDGMVFKSMRVDVTLSCMMDLAQFPMDTQHCNMIIQSCSNIVVNHESEIGINYYEKIESRLLRVILQDLIEDAYVQNILNLTWHVDEKAGFPISNNPNIKLNDMTVADRSFQYCSNVYPMFRGSGLWSCLNGTITMKRHVLFHVIQTYIPTSMLVWLSWLSFWLDPKAAPARISLTITTLLTLTTMSNGARNDLPQVSYIKALDVWLTVCTGFVFCVLLEYTMVSRYVTRKTTHCIHSVLSATINDNAEQRRPSPIFSSRLKSPTLHHRRIFDDRNMNQQQQNSDNYNLTLNHMSQENIDCSSPSCCEFQRYNQTLSDPCIRLHQLTHADDPLLPPNGNKHSITVPRRPFRHELPSRPCLICSARWERVARKIDRCSRIGFPLTFGLFVTLYWLCYKVWDMG